MATAKAGAQTTINNELKVAAATATIRESLKQLKEDDMMRGMTNPSTERNDNGNGGGLGAENGVNGGDINEEAV